MQNTERAIKQAVQTIYKRELPPNLISFSSPQGKLNGQKLIIQKKMPK